MPLLFFRVFKLGELRAEFQQLCSEVCDAVFSFGCFVGDEFDVDGALVVIESAREGGQRGCYLPLESGVGPGAVGEGGQVGANGFGLPQGGVVQGALYGI